MRIVTVFALLFGLVLATSAFADDSAGEHSSTNEHGNLKDTHGASSHHGAARSHGGKALKSGANLNLLPEKKSDPSVATRPGRPELKAPTALATVSGTSTQLAWNEVQGAESYHVQVATDANFRWLMVNENFVKSNSFDISGLEAGKQYFWRIAARTPNNEPEYSKGDFTASSFSVK